MVETAPVALSDLMNVTAPAALPGLTSQAPAAGLDFVSITLALAPVIAFILLLYWGLQKKQRKDRVIELSYYLIILELVLIALLPICGQLLPCFGWAFVPIMMFGALMGFVGHRRKKEIEHKAHVSKAAAEGFIKQMPQVQTLHGPGLSSMNAPSRPTNPIGMLIYYFNKPKHVISEMAEAKEKKPKEAKPKEEPLVFQKKTESWKTRLERMGKSPEGDSKAEPDEKEEEKKGEKPAPEWKRSLGGEAPDIAKETTRKDDGGKKLPQKKLFEPWGASRGPSKGAAAQPQRQQSKPNYVERKIIETINRESSASNRESLASKAKRAPPAESFSGKRFERRFEKPAEKPAENAPHDLSWESKFDKWKQKRARTGAEDGETKSALREIQKQKAEASDDADRKKIHGIIEDVLNRRKLAEGKPEEKP